ncbi:MAG: glycosyltransferase family 4 protein [Verrucomicrobiae bacterium]|nr:glycosyltransferase family 4 protein [Verrucomicrobiae bacterium]
MGKLRIAVWHNLPSGGAKRLLWHYIDGLSKRGHYVEAWCPATADQKYMPLGGLCTEHILPFTLPEEKKTLPLLGWIADRATMQARIAALREHGRECARQITAGGFDVLLANSCRFLTMPAIARYVKIPKAIVLGEPNRRLYEAMPELMWAAPAPRGDGELMAGFFPLLRSTLKLKHLRLQMREEIENAKHFDRILVNSFFSRESVLRAYGLESEVCYLGVDTGYFQPTEGVKGKYVIGLGSVHFHKGVDRAIRAVGMMPAAGRPKLIWVGNDSSEQTTREYRELAQSLGVELEIKVLVPDAELIALLGRAAAMLYTSRLEPFGMAPLEANACGTPVVAVAEGGVRETLAPGENGLLAADARPETIAATLRELLENPARLAELRGRCRAAVVARWDMSGAVTRLETSLTALTMEKSRA